MPTIDLNADLGESFGAWHMGEDEAVMPWVTSANIACGQHAGDPMTMRHTVESAVKHSVAIGAHPSLPDLQGFGRRTMQITPAEAYALTLSQIGTLYAFVHAAGARLHHVKAHGALYNMAARDRALAEALARALRDFDPGLALMGLAGSELIAAGRAAGLAVIREGFCDRRYRPDGSLAPRSEPGAVIENPGAAVAQAVAIATQQRVTATDGSIISVQVDSLCVHGDRANAGTFARCLRAALEQADVKVAVTRGIQ